MGYKNGMHSPGNRGGNEYLEFSIKILRRYSFEGEVRDFVGPINCCSFAFVMAVAIAYLNFLVVAMKPNSYFDDWELDLVFLLLARPFLTLPIVIFSC